MNAVPLFLFPTEELFFTVWSVLLYFTRFSRTFVSRLGIHPQVECSLLKNFFLPFSPPFSSKTSHDFSPVISLSA